MTLVFFGAFFVWPLLQVLRGGFVDVRGATTLTYAHAILADPTYVAGFGNALALAGATTALAFALSLPLAWLTTRYRFPAQNLVGTLILAPLILPPFVGAIGIKQVFGQYGAFNALLHATHLLPPHATIDWFAAHQFWGVAIVEALSLYPIVYLNATAALAAVDPAMEEAAENLGCTGWRRFRRITLPLIRPGLFGSGTIVFIWSLTELGTPLVFDYNRVTSVQIYEGLKDIGANPVPYALVSLLLAASVSLYALGKGVFGRTPPALAAKSSAAVGLRRLPRGRSWLCTAAFVGVTAIAALPHLAVILTACSRDWYASVLPGQWTPKNFQLALGHDLTVPAIANSLRFAGIATIIDVILGVAIGYVVARSRSPLRHVLDTLAMLPLAVPGLVLAFGYVAMAQDGRAFAWLNPTKNPTVLLIVAYSIRRLPYVVRSAAAGFQQTSVALEEAAQNLGAPPLRAVAKATLPLIAANLAAGALLAFAFAMLEVSDSLILAQKQSFYPITKAILELLQLLGDGKFLASALGTWAMAFLGAVVAALALLLGKRLSSVFRV